ncbi:MAG: DoxX family protein [Candidatus Taylorbacteria bacterium]|nr:DoxX family protein [Candidatus Taylorbacteria bacterium]
MHFVSKLVGHRPNAAVLVLRLVVGLVFLVHGIQKLGGMDQTIGFFQAIGIPAAAFFAWVVALVETLGGIALIIGIGTHIASVLLAVVMLVAIFTVKLSKGFSGGYEFDLVLLASLIGFILNGAGKISLDAKCKCDNCQVTPPAQM